VGQFICSLNGFSWKQGGPKMNDYGEILIYKSDDGLTNIDETVAHTRDFSRELATG
jgi:hypothetical protein